MSPLSGAPVQHHQLKIASPLATQLTWTDITELLTICDWGKRDFYSRSAQ